MLAMFSVWFLTALLFGSSVAVDISILQSHIKGVSSVNLILCWEPHKLLNFLKAICDGDTQKVSCRVLNFDESDLPTKRLEAFAIILMDLGCENTWSFVEDNDFHKYNDFQWIFINTIETGNSIREEKLLEIMKSKNLGPSSEISYTVIDGNKTVVKQIYKDSKSTPLISELFGIWSNGTTKIQQNETVTSKRRRNLHRAQIRGSMVVTDNDTLNHLNDYRDNHIDSITKLNYVLTRYVMDFMNASGQYSIVSTWGYLDKESGEWSGMIGELTKDTADIGATALFFTKDRIPIIQYVARTTRTVSRFIFQSPKLSYTDNVFVLPFSRVVWMCIISLIPLVGISLALVTWVEWKTERNDPTNSGLLQPSLRDSLQLVIGAVCQQGSSTMPKSLSARILAFLIFIVLMFLYASYSANIVALLQSPSNKIQTLEDLLHSRISLGVDDIVYTKFYVPRQTEKVKKQIYEKKIKTSDGKGNYVSRPEGVARIRKGLYAFFVETGPGYKMISETFDEDEKCGLQEMEYLRVLDPYFSIQKNSTYKELIKIGLFRVFEHGLQNREQNRIYTKKPKCAGNGGKFVSVSIIDVEPALLLLCWGFAVALTTFLCEHFVNKYKVLTINSM